MADSFILVRALHILFAISWAGAAVYRSSVLEAAMRRDPELATRFFAGARHGPFMGITAIGTVLMGGAVLGAADGAFGSDVLSTGQFMVLYGAVTAATLAFILGLAGHMPIDRQISPLARKRLAGEDHDEALYERLARREHVLGRISMGLITVGMLGMTTYRLF